MQFVTCSLWWILLDYSKAWIMEIQPCGTCRASFLGLHKFISTQILWISPLRVSLNFLARALVTEPTGTWIGFAFHLFVVPSSQHVFLLKIIKQILRNNQTNIKIVKNDTKQGQWHAYSWDFEIKVVESASG